MCTAALKTEFQQGAFLYFFSVMTFGDKSMPVRDKGTQALSEESSLFRSNTDLWVIDRGYHLPSVLRHPAHPDVVSLSLVGFLGSASSTRIFRTHQ